MKKPQTSFERFEFKYWVPQPVAAELLERVSPYLRCDDWALGGQRNTSLYLDSPELDFLRLHTESAPDRSKLRVRAYGEPPTGPAFFEIKRKVKKVTLKQRAVVPLASVPELLRGEIPPSLQLSSEEERRTLEHFLYLMIAYRAEPRVLVTCRREAFTSIDPNDEVRLTLDRDVCYQEPLGYTLRSDPKAWINLCGLGSYEAESPTLIELKFRGAAPLWVADLAQQLRLRATAYSKYVMAMTRRDLGLEEIFGTDLEIAADAQPGWGL